MKNKMKGFIAAIALALPVAGQATMISWDSGSGDYLGFADSSTGAAACSSGDFCALTQTWDLGAGLSVTVSAYDSFSGRPYDGSYVNAPLHVWHDANPAMGGLGSAHYDDLGDSSADNNSGGESLYLEFSSAVSIDTLYFNGNHTGFDGYTFLFYGMGAATNQLNNVYNNGAISLNGTMLTSLWIEPDWDYLPTDPWYLSGLSYNVPEPMPIALLGLGLIGLIISRKKLA
ncbi:PEP-CTERM sorting domain-containing protein [Simiduia sp. 21SJ11W-1]|uniref:PEP-CTERM sorting domain-containing protein n=1 Tax=Simiduia sp. 21SJ11W-1 TaxID=2909669 RepID=UPI0020A1B560|nr:PEP-CTERM sorting domain-containing protein [Simiduia sp. 21SJ11W-1]UTA47669.1 PEP-CTERM sorting domain-containing protein [Simiduia sp. 21SJ11W-1]